MAALAWFFLVSLCQAEDGFLKDMSGGCAVFKPNLKAGETVVWQGPCATGYGQGNGVAKWSAGDGSSLTFEGNFAQGKLQGNGKMTASGGDRYTGAYKDGKRDGRGVYFSANGDRYDGEYKDNQRHGHGSLTLASGQRLEGDWVNGIQVASNTPAPGVSALTTPPLAGATIPLTLAPQLRRDATPQAQAPTQAVADSPPPQGTQPVLTPRQQAQQQQVARQQQQQVERQRVQEERAQQQLALQEKQRQLVADQRRAYERQQMIDQILFWLLMASPILLAVLVRQLKWQHAVTASDAVASWVDRRDAKARERSGYFVDFVERPLLWCSRKLFEFTATMGNQFLKAGVRLALCLYLVGIVLFLAYVVTVIVITIAIAVAAFYVLGKSLGDNNERSQSSSRSELGPSYAASEGESRHRKGIFGDYTETRDANDNVVAESRERKGIFGDYTETRDANDNVVAESRERKGIFGDYIETRDAEGNLVAESRQREGLLGPYVEHKRVKP